MKLYVLSALAMLSLSSLAAAGKLSAQYLPPNQAGASAGHAGFLQGPAYAHQASHYNAGAHYAAAASSSAAAHQAYSHNPIPILRSTADNDGNGNYNFGFETGNGIRRDETGIYTPGHPEGSQAVSGSYSFTGDDGQTYTVNYKADHNGFHAEGAHLPTPPPIPREIQESLALHQNAHAASYAGHAAGYGGHAAASARQPASVYLPPQQQQRGYNYGPGHY